MNITTITPNMIRVKLILFVFVLSIIQITCSSPNQINNLGNKVVHFPNYLEKYNNNIYPCPDYKLLIIFNGSCSICIASLNEWSRVLNNELAEFNIEPIFIGINSDKEILKYNLDNIGFKYNVIIDNDSSFYKANPKLQFSDNDFCLLSHNNKMLMKGNSKPELALRKYLIEPRNMQK